LLLTLPACVGIRHGTLPRQPQDYRPLALADVVALGLHDQNVEIVATLGPMLSDDLCDLISFPLMGPLPALGDASPAAFAALTAGFGGLTVTLPRARYEEVRSLAPFSRVRVRGYLSQWMAESCGASGRSSDRYLWIDSITPAGQGG
jgi:hypothetical protein